MKKIRGRSLSQTHPENQSYIYIWKRMLKLTFKWGSKVQDDEVCWVEMAIRAPGPRAGGGLGGWGRQPQFIQTLVALQPLLVWLLPRWARVAPPHANLQAPTQDLVYKRSAFMHTFVQRSHQNKCHTHESKQTRDGQILRKGWKNKLKTIFSGSTQASAYITAGGLMSLLKIKLLEILFGVSVNMQKNKS